MVLLLMNVHRRADVSQRRDFHPLRGSGGSLLSYIYLRGISLVITVLNLGVSTE
uniref:Uncharacterized protein n=1 Tax=Solanum lycopersicum TaxID=4081 RepID=A0A3Q7IJ51_SOLLC